MKLSIIIPVYNVEDYLAKCLDSLIYEGLTDYEIICVDDGSTDRSGDIAEEYALNQPGLIRVLHQENGGVGAARNTGIDAAVGEYLLFVDSDDYLSHGALPEMLKTLERDFDICLFNGIHVNGNGKILKHIDNYLRQGCFNIESYPRLLLAHTEAWGKLFRRRLFTETGIRFPSRVWYEDLRTVFKLFLEADRVECVQKTWYNYLFRPGSIMNSGNNQRNLEIIDAADDLIAYFRQRGAYERYKPELEYLCFYHEFLTASVRVNLADRSSPVQDRLREDFLAKYPDFAENPYIKNISVGHRLLTRLLLRKKRLSVHLLMRLNSLLKRGRV